MRKTNPTQVDSQVREDAADWRWQVANSQIGYGNLPRVVREKVSESLFESIFAALPVAVTPYYRSLMNEEDPLDPILRMVYPDPMEVLCSTNSCPDPICEEAHAVMPGLVRRYPDRALLLVSGTCAAYCRFCTRRVMGTGRIVPMGQSELDRAIQFIGAHPEIVDVIISGGDPLLLDDQALLSVVEKVRRIPSVEIIRIASRVPVTLPMRVTRSLCQALGRYGPLFLNTHFNHSRELTREAAEAIDCFVDAGIPVNNQSVLLLGVNDNEEELAALCRGLLRHRVRPYYLFIGDLVKGTGHLRVPFDRAVSLAGSLRGTVSGLAIPTLVVDLPGGLGKIPITPEYIVERQADCLILRAPGGQMVSYPLS